MPPLTKAFEFVSLAPIAYSEAWFRELRASLRMKLVADLIGDTRLMLCVGPKDSSRPLLVQEGDAKRGSVKRATYAAL